jgi:hypothetical protein
VAVAHIEAIPDLQKAEPNLLSQFEQGYGDLHEKQQGVLRNVFQLRCWNFGFSAGSEFEPFWQRGYAKFDPQFQHSVDWHGGDPKHAGSDDSFADFAFGSDRNFGHVFRELEPK